MNEASAMIEDRDPPATGEPPAPPTVEIAAEAPIFDRAKSGEPSLAAFIGQRARDFRIAQDKTLMDVAERAKTTPQTVQRLETANMTMTVEWMEKLAYALDVHPSALMPTMSSVNSDNVTFLTGAVMVELSSTKGAIEEGEDVARLIRDIRRMATVMMVAKRNGAI